MLNNNTKIIIEIIVALLVIAVGYYLFTTYNAPQEEVETVQDKIAEQADIKPVKNLPEPNPFEAETNPFSGGYKNPFGN